MPLEVEKDAHRIRIRPHQSFPMVRLSMIADGKPVGMMKRKGVYGKLIETLTLDFNLEEKGLAPLQVRSFYETRRRKRVYLGICKVKGVSVLHWLSI